MIASYRAFEQYLQVNKEFESSNVNIGGFNVPINSLLKKASGEPIDHNNNEAIKLVYQTNQVQKWLIYWIVFTSFNVISSIFFLDKLIPLYGSIKTIIFIWLLSPMVQFSSVNGYDPKQDWERFYGSGCGYSYVNYIKPWLNGDIPILNDFSIDINSIYGSFDNTISYLVGSITTSTSLLGKLYPNNGNESSETKSNASSIPSPSVIGVDYINSIKSSQLFQSYFNPKQQEEKVEEEYDVIDTPTKTSSATGTEQVPHNDDESKPRKRGWFW